MPATIASKTARAVGIKDITNGALRALIGTRNAATMGLKQGSTVTDIVTAAASTYYYVLGGVYKSLTGSAASNWALSLANTMNYKAIAAVTGVTQYTNFILAVDAAGTGFYAVQGPVVTAATDQTFGDMPLSSNGVPTITTSAGAVVEVCPVGYITVAVTSGNVFTPGTTSLTGTGVTTTYVNVENLPVAV